MNDRHWTRIVEELLKMRGWRRGDETREAVEHAWREVTEFPWPTDLMHMTPASAAHDVWMWSIYRSDR